MIVTVFPRRTCSAGEARVCTWRAFVRALERAREIRNEQDKLELPLYSPAEFRNGHRSREDMIGCWALTFDLDAEPTIAPADLAARMSGHAAAIISSSRHRPEAPRSRLHWGLSRPVADDEQRVLWGYGARWIGQFCGVGREAKDSSRVLFVPAHLPGVAFEHHHVDGHPLDVDRVLDEERERADEERPPPAPRSYGSTPSIERVRRYVAQMDAAISGSGGHKQTFRVALVIVANVADESTQFALLCEYNARCQPKWSPRELLHKLKDARRRPDLRPLEDRQRCA